jgi:hypothetical protein
MVEVAALFVFTIPKESFTRWGFHDSGADLSIRAMIARGLRPTIDFGYIYGLLTLKINDLWQTCFGSTPTACRGATLLGRLIFAVGLARLASALKIGPSGVALLIVAMPDMLMTSAFALVHVLEPALLINALAFQAKGRRSTALALATVSVFIKPTMGYLYGLILVIGIVAIERRRAWRSLVPAAVVGISLAAVLTFNYGPTPLLRTIFPGGGMAVYRAQHYGFFNEGGRLFWMRAGGLRDYFRYEVGGWLVGTAILTIGGFLSIVRLYRMKGSRRDEVILTCSVLHLIFVLAFFGNRLSWIYYYSILIAGIAAIDTLGKRQAVAVLALALIVVVGSKVKMQDDARLWRTDRPSPETFGLWAPELQHAEWRQALKEIEGSTPVGLLAICEGAAVLAPNLFLPPDCSYLVEGHTVPAEVRRKAGTIARSSMIVCTAPPARYNAWPEIAAALDGCRLARESGMFWVLRRERPPSGSVPSDRQIHP